jgi:spermidine synthase
MTDSLVAGKPLSANIASGGRGAAYPGSTALDGRRFLPALILLFVGSGCAALVYEVVWLQLLGLVIGASAISLGVLLGTFMGGMCLGSLLFPRFVSKAAHPLRVYATLELLIGVIGVLELVLVPVVANLYTHLGIGSGPLSVVLRAVLAGICLLPPTVLMGATLPAIARYVEATPRGVSWLGFFYGGNIVGAVFGCLLAGFYLLPNYDMKTASFVAAAINVFVAVLGYALSAAATYHATAEEAPSQKAARVPWAWTVYASIGLSGMTALGAEVVWTRLLSLTLGATVYTFSIILAVFLTGLGAGSSVGAMIARNARQPRIALGVCQFLVAGAIAWTSYAISFSLPFWPVDPTLSTSPWVTFQIDLARCFWAVFPGAILWGMSFPIALAAVAARGQDAGKLVGGVYAANTVGAILGALAFSMWLVPALSTRGAQQILIVLCAISGVLMLVPLVAGFGRREEAEVSEGNVVGLTLGVGAALGACAFILVNISAPNWAAVAWGRNSATEIGSNDWPIFPAVLSEEEVIVLRDAKSRNLDLRLVDGEILSRPSHDAWAVDNKASLIQAVQKGAAASGDEKTLLDLAKGRGMDLRVKNGELYNAKLDEWATANKDGLMAVLKKRRSLTGDGSLLSYNEKYPNRYCQFVGEGMNVSVAVTTDDWGYRYFHGAGKVQASSKPEDMRLQRMLGHLTALMKPDPQDVLVVACGAGVTAGSFVPYESNITIVDIEPMVPRYVTPRFWKENHDVIPPSWSGRPTGYKKTDIHIDDGRHYIRTTGKKFDIITSDPIDPWVKGCAALNTVEYYQMCKDHLKPGGVVALWIPLYESSEDTAKSVIATFFEVFPNGIIFSNDNNGVGYDAVLFAKVGEDGSVDKPTKIDLDAIQAYIDAHPAVKQSMRDVGFGSLTANIPGSCEAVEIFASYAGTGLRLKEWAKGTEHLINRDSNLRLQYVAGMGVNQYIQERILNNILKYYRYPDDMFSGSPEKIEALKKLFAQTRRVEQP